MKFEPIDSLQIPENLIEYLEENEFLEDENFEPINITIEQIQYRGEDMFSFQADFEILDEYENIDGDDWEKLIRIYIGEKEPELLKYLKGDSDSSTCVIWTNSESKFKKILSRMIELLENKEEIIRIEKVASR